jgi:hypothetical protein
MVFQGENPTNIIDSTVNDYYEKNIQAIEHLNMTKYPENVHFIYPKDIFCKNGECYAVLNGMALYFDDDHPSVYGASLLVEPISVF